MGIVLRKIVERSQLGFAVATFIVSVLAPACGDDKASTTTTSTLPVGAVAGAPGASNCPVGQLSCAGVCTDVRSSATNCGTCAHSCGLGICDNGQCACASTLTTCQGVCVDTTSDASHCGNCGALCAPGQICSAGRCTLPCAPVCTSGQSCVDGACQCPAGQQVCAGACVDVLTTPAHCGSCEKACAPDQLCQQGACQCPPGQMMCGETCADLQLSPKSCGSCGNVCGDGEVCMAGACRGPAGADGCSGGAPRDLSISEVAAYQSVKVALSRAATPIDPMQRSSQIVQGRATVFRVSVSLNTPFNARQLSARVTLKNGTGEDQYFAKQMVSKASTDADSSSTFQVFVPGDRIADDTRYSVELVECGGTSAGGTATVPATPTTPTTPTTPVTPDAGTPGTPTTPDAGTPPGRDAGMGNPMNPGTGMPGTTTPPPATPGTPGARLPAMGDLDLAARDTGILKVKVIPIRTGNFVPDTSDKSLQVYKDYILSIYPISKIEISVGTEVMSSDPPNWNTVIEQIRSKRQSDNPPADTYYYGFLKPTSTIAEYCRRGCTAGVGYVASATQASTRAALGLAFADALSAVAMAHEIGHNHGRNHAPCAQGGQISGVDRRYPYTGAQIGVWGYDPTKKAFLDPVKTTDLMGYCDPKWISDYTYNGILDRSIAVNSKALILADPATIQRYWVVLDDADGPRWSQPFPAPSEAYGDPETAEVLDVDEQPIDRVTVYRTHIGDSEGASSVLVPEPKDGWNSIRLQNAPALPFSAPVTVPTP